MNSYSINGNFIYEGFILENNGGLISWNYTERGEKNTLKYFLSEKEAAEYALAQIKSDQYANLNYIGMYKDNIELQKILLELEKREIKYRTDKIPFGGLNDVRTRVYIIGCGIKHVRDLIKKDENK